MSDKQPRKIILVGGSGQCAHPLSQPFSKWVSIPSPPSAVQTRLRPSHPMSESSEAPTMTQDRLHHLCTTRSRCPHTPAQFDGTQQRRAQLGRRIVEQEYMPVAAPR